jgi:hypothetical protein
MTKKTTKPVPTAGGNDEIGLGLHGLAKAMEGVGEELQPLYKIEELNEALSAIASALHDQANISRMSIVAQYGTQEDREVALKYLKDHFEGYFHAN